MPASRVLFLLMGLFAPMISWSQSSPPHAISQHLPAIQAVASATQQPYVVFISQKKQRVSKHLLRDVWHHVQVRAQLDSNFLSVVLDIKEVDTTWLKEQYIFQAPTILIFRPNHQLMGRIDGFVAAETFSNILLKHHKRLKPINKYQAAPLVLPPVPALQWLTDAPPTNLIASRGMPSPSQRLGVSGLEVFSIDRLIPRPYPQIGVVYASYSNRLNAIRQVKSLEKVWHRDIWVYRSQSTPQAPIIYRLVLGTFHDINRAAFYAQAMADQFHIQPQFVELNDLLSN